MSRILPILFNTEMVRAILNDRKTVTRRIISEPYRIQGDENDKRTIIAVRTAPKGSKLYRQIGEMPYPDSPYKIGDILYVRETWSTKQSNACIGNTSGRCPYDSCETAIGPCFDDEYIYKASDSLDSSVRKWHPSIHMPKEAARIWLEVTDVRVERLQDITEDQAEMEGCGEYQTEAKFSVSPRCHFYEVWESTIKASDKKRYGWEANPFVWVIEFERCEKPSE